MFGTDDHNSMFSVVSRCCILSPCMHTMQEGAVTLCMATLDDGFEGVIDAEWKQALVSLGLCCGVLGRHKDLPMVAEQLEMTGIAVKQLPAALRGQLLLAYMQLGEWDKGGRMFDSCPETDWRPHGLEVQEAYCALHANPRQGLKGLLALAAEGHPVGAMAVRGLLASCERGVYA
jgi:hypothetical protein